jgi:hypothetical protein
MRLRRANVHSFSKPLTGAGRNTRVSAVQISLQVYIVIYRFHWRIDTANQTAKLFNSGRSQAVRLPAEFRFEGTEVYIRKEGE